MPKRLLLLFLISAFFSATAREYTQPPGIALRNPLAYIVLAQLKTITAAENQKWNLVFDKINDLHNSYESELSFKVDRQLAQALQAEQNYVIAFQTHRITKKEGIKKYIPFKEGPSFISVQGADPAIFIENEQLIKQLKADPKLATTKPELLIKDIMSGMAQDDPKIKEFFIRELINWNGLPSALSQNDLNFLNGVLLDTELSAGALTAFFENRPEFHQALGLENLLNRAKNLLANTPVNQNDGGQISTLIYTALHLLKVHEAGEYNLFSRWLVSDNPAITELALLQMHELNPSATLQTVQQKLNHTLIHDASRRVLVRYVKKYIETN